MEASSEQSDRDQETKNLRVVEFFSGVGGLHCAVKACGVPCTVVAAVEINTVANAVYQHNFPEVDLMQRNLEGFTVDDFASFDADMFVMSPPCQPFTRVGLKGDKNDARTNAFFNIMRNLAEMAKKPTYLLVENVKGFDTSETRNFLVETLQKCNYVFQEFLLSPMNIGIPNQRVRYFMLAKQRPLQFKEEHGTQLVQHRVNMPLMPNEIKETSRLVCDNSMVSSQEQTNMELTESRERTGQDESSMVSLNEQSIERKTDEQHLNEKERTDNVKSGSCEDMVSSSEQNEQETGEDDERRKIGDYLQADLSEESMAEYLIPDRILLKYVNVMDIVTVEDTKTCCFTKAYAYYVEGTGSVLRTDLSADNGFSKLLVRHIGINIQTEEVSFNRALWASSSRRCFACFHHHPVDCCLSLTFSNVELFRNNYLYCRRNNMHNRLSQSMICVMIR
ncbi:tRNA (cytosine(38)-C(5))-methyltransferase isoform X1 [Strongylocentrotus purpuratus]|uniref:DNA methyltransferase 2 n=1 Tax=Strongylocentrotus purpuratus TaxID=7668 RepID=A0A7M7PBU3_STRPU|nr:tRNA (cytosine(38)-C(5))-methyltransferase isoform X1 [Strongylocentrotus purpuratus]XP_030849340.1 tRNA (cytosine(38)-C(5))-methyltransferase isoform X1 [Strongylocentrotus purpuratus]